MSELLAAVYAGDEARVAELLAVEPELDVFEAAAVGRADRVGELLDADPGLAAAWAEDGFTPLHLAAFFRHPETARLLVDRGAPVDAVARNEAIAVTPLQSAVTAANEETAALLLKRGADPNFRHGEGFTPLHAAAHHGSERLVDLLLAYGGDRLLADDQGRTPAAYARNAGHEALAARLESG
ncbi:MAG: ankyrin repeat domain-containing protein [Gaiellaceae bacterium]